MTDLTLALSIKATSENASYQWAMPTSSWTCPLACKLQKMIELEICHLLDKAMELVCKKTQVVEAIGKEEDF